MSAPLDVLLIRPERPDPRKCPVGLGDGFPPLGLGFLKAYVRSKGFTAEILDNYVRPTPECSTAATVAYVRARNPRFVGIYVSSPSLNEALALIGALADQTSVPLVVGGPHYTVFPERAPLSVRHVVVGEGETALWRILSGTAADRVLREPVIVDLDELPFPAPDDFLTTGYEHAVPMFEMPPTVVTMNTSRGCPHECLFCSVQEIWGRRYRTFSADRVFDHVARLRRDHGVSGVYFREDNFACHAKRVHRFCDLQLEAPSRCHWACEARVDTLHRDRELLPHMAAAGCRGVFLGIESGSQRVLDLMKKGTSVDQNRWVLRECRRVGIRTYASMCYGFPGETPGDRAVTRRFLEDTQPDTVSEAVYIGIPTSPIYHRIKETGAFYHEDAAGFVFPTGYEALCRTFYPPVDGRFIPPEEVAS
jgi:anaerobic magnesium-protoporphyrin IX monomethyl ester cyclase